LLQEAWNTHPAWLLKPPTGTDSIGVWATKNFTEVSMIKKRMVAQKFFANPHLVNGRAVEYRVLLLVTSVLPLRLYVTYNANVKIGLGAFSLRNLSSPCGTINGPIHMSECGVSNEERLEPIIKFMEEEFGSAESKKLKDTFESIIIRTILSIHKNQEQRVLKNLFNLYNGFQLLSFDFFLDSKLEPWLNEVNVNPNTYVTADLQLPFLTWTHALNIAGYHFPPNLPKKARRILRSALLDSGLRLNSEFLTFNEKMYEIRLSERELEKQSHFIKQYLKSKEPVPMGILNSLTEDDTRHLKLSEDEVSRSRNSVYRRIYPPASIPGNPYLKFITSKRGIYYALLFNAWNALNDTRRKEIMYRRFNLL
jgi:hypothetical protein